MKIIQTFIYCFTIWIIAAVINACMAATLLSFVDMRIESWPGAFVLALIGSLLFSAPGIFILWIVFVVNVDEEELFRILLKWGIVLSIGTSIIFICTFGNDCSRQSFSIILFGVASAIITIMIHHKAIVSINKSINH